MSRLQQADEEYYATATYVLELVKQADELYQEATVDEKRELIALVCQNLTLDGKSLRLSLKEPFNTIANHVNGSLWLADLDAATPTASESARVVHGYGLNKLAIAIPLS